MHMTEANDQRANNNAHKGPGLRRRKGWKGFVWGYNDWIKAAEGEGRWDAISWGKDGNKSGASAIVKDEFHNKTVYKY